MVEKFDPKIKDETLTDGGRGPPLNKSQSGLGQCSSYHKQAKNGEPTTVTLGDCTVDDLPEQQRGNHAQKGRRSDRSEEPDDHRSVWTGEAPDPSSRFLADTGRRGRLVRHHVKETHGVGHRRSLWSVRPWWRSWLMSPHHGSLEPVHSGLSSTPPGERIFIKVD